MSALPLSVSSLDLPGASVRPALSFRARFASAKIDKASTPIALNSLSVETEIMASSATSASAPLSKVTSAVKTASEVSLAKSESKLVRERTAQGADTRLTRFLRAAYPGKTVDNVATDLGVSRGTAKNWVEGKSTPGFFYTLKLIAKYGPEFLVAVYPNAPRWLDQAYRDHQEAILTQQRAIIDRQLDASRQRRQEAR